MRTFRAKLFSLDGTPDSKGELFAPGAVKNFSTAVPLRDQTGKEIGKAKLARAQEGEEGVYFEAEVSDDTFPGGDTFFTASAVVYDCDHRFNERGESVAVRLNDADVFEVKVTVTNPDTRIKPAKVPFLPHDGANTEPNE